MCVFLHLCQVSRRTYKHSSSKMFLNCIYEPLLFSCFAFTCFHFAKHPERYYKLSVIISLGYRPCAVQVYIIIMYYLLNPLRLITTYYVEKLFAGSFLTTKMLKTAWYNYNYAVFPKTPNWMSSHKQLYSIYRKQWSKTYWAFPHRWYSTCWDGTLLWAAKRAKK